MTTPPVHRLILEEIHDAMAALVEGGLADDQNSAYESQVGADTFIVRYSNIAPFGPLLRNVSYSKTYLEQRRERSFNFLMLDGAMIQMVYEFAFGRIVRHRLAFLPSPDLLEFQNHADLYEEEVVYADVIDKRVVTVPLRFDFDSRDGVHVELDHPISHLTLGQYSACRVPVTAALTPHVFLDFVLRSFYNRASGVTAQAWPGPRHRFQDCITDRERTVLHMGVPIGF